MNLTTEQLNELEDMAYKLIDLSVMAVVLEVAELDLDAAIRDKSSEEYKAYYKGFGRQLIEQRASLIRSASNGSNPAQEALAKITESFVNSMPKPFAL